MKTLIPLLLIGLVLTACEQPIVNDAQTPEVAVEAPGAVSAEVLYAVPSDVYEQTTEAERKAAMLAALEVYHGEAEGSLDVGHFLRSQAPLPEKHEAAQALLAGRMDQEWYFLQQMLAAPMLELFLESEVGRQDAEALGTYTELLVRNENPSGDLIAQALPLLKGHWSDAQIAQAADASWHAATKWLSQSCPDCGPDGTRRTAGAALVAQTETPRYAAIQASLTTLDQLRSR